MLADKMTMLTDAIRSLGGEFPILGKEICSVVQVLGSRILQTEVDLDASCSDSHFP
jgi:hypothetical protein